MLEINLQRNASKISQLEEFFLMLLHTYILYIFSYLTCSFLKKDTTVSKGQSTERVLVEIGKISQLNLVHFARSFH